MPLPNPEFSEVPAPAYESTEFDYDVDARTLKASSNPVPPQVAGEEAILAAFTEYENPTSKIVQDIISHYEQGASPVVEGIKTRAAQQHNQKALQAEYNKYATGEQSLEAMERKLASTPAASEDDFSDLHQQMMNARLFRNQAQSSLDQLLAKEKIEELVHQGYPWRQAIADRIEWELSEMDPNAAGLVGGMLVDMAPALTTIAWKQAFAKVFPDQEFGFNPLNYARGELAVAFRERMAKLPREEQFEVANLFIDAIIENDNLLTSTQFQKTMILQEALGQGFTTTDRVIGDIISLLDGVLLGGVARSVFRGAKRIFTPGTPISTLNIVDPKSAEQLAAQAIKTDMKSTVGMSPVDLVEVAVSPKNKATELLPPSIVNQLTKSTQQIRDLYQRTAHNPLATTETEQIEILRDFRNEVKNVGTSGMYGSNTYIPKRTDEGIEFIATYGVRQADGTIVPYKTPAQTLEAARHNFPDAKEIVIKQRTAKNKLVPIDPLTKKGRVPSNAVGEYVYEIKGFKGYASIANRSENVTIKEGDIVHAGPGSKWGLDPASRFAKWISGAFGQAGDVGRGIDASLKGIAKPFTSLKIDKQRDVVALLQRYAEKAETMDTAQIIAAAKGDTKVLEGFYAYRQTMDALWLLEQRNFRNELIQQDAKHIVIGDYQGTGTRMQQSTLFKLAGETGKDSLEVYNATQKKIVTLSPKQINKLHADGKSIYRTIESVGNLKKQSNLVIVAKADAIRELPLVVLKKTDGYIPRYYKDTYFVRRVVDGTMNGKAEKNVQILRAVGDMGEANQAVKQLVAEGKLSVEEAEHAIVHDRTLTPKDRATIEMQDTVSLGRMFYHKRNKERLRGIDGLAEVSDPVEAMMSNIQSTSKFVSNFEVLSTMKQRWMNTFGTKHRLVSKDTAFPTSADEIGASYVHADSVKKEALELWNHIRNMESLSTREGELWRDTFTDIADGIIGTRTEVGLFRDAASKGAKSVSETSANKLARQISFGLLISGNPFRQLLVQAQQFTFLSILQPTKIMKIWNRGWAIRHGVLKNTSPALYNMRKDAAAKTMGLSTKEYDDYMKLFDETGIPHSIDSHDYVAKAMDEFTSTLNDGKLTAARKGVWKATVTTPLGYGKKGFDHGELVNLTNTFATAEQRFFTRTGKTALKTKKDFAEVAAEARQIALDMTHTGALRYQNGGMSALTQFLSIRHKALLAVSPFKIGNQTFTQAERKRLLAGQLLINGATGLGLHKLYKMARDELGFELPEEVETAIVGGMMETVVNQGIELASGEKSNLNIAGSMAPAGGLIDSAGDLVEVLLGNKSFVELAAATSAMGRIHDTFKTFNAINQFTALDNDRALISHIENFASMTSGYSQALRARAAMRLGVHVSNAGSPTVQASYTSALAEGLFGIQQREVEEYYDLQNEFSNEIKNTTGLFDKDKYTSQQAAALYKQVQRVVTLFNDEFDPDIEAEDMDVLSKVQLQRMRAGMQMHGEILALYDGVERDRIWQKFTNIAQQDRTRGVDSLIDKIIKTIYRGDMSGSSAEYAISRLRASGLYDPKSERGKQIEDMTKTLQENLYMQNASSDQNMKMIQEMENGKN